MDDFPSPPPSTELSATVDARQLVSAAARVLPSAAGDDSRPVLTAIHWRAGKVAAADGFRLAVAPLALQSGALHEEELLPGTLFRRASEILAGYDGPVRLVANEKATYVGLDHDGIEVRCARVQGTYPNYAQLIPEERNTRILFPNGAVLHALKLLEPVALNGSGIVRIVAKPDGTTLRAVADPDEAEVKLLCPVEGTPAKVALNWRYLRDAFGAIRGDALFDVISPSQQVVIRDTAEPEFVQVVMPMVVDWEPG